MKTIATAIAMSSVLMLLLPPADRRALVRRRGSSPSWLTTRMAVPSAMTLPPADLAVHSSLTTRTTPDGARSVLATPRVPTATVETPPAPKVSSFAPRRRWAARTTPTTIEDHDDHHDRAGKELVARHVVTCCAVEPTEPAGSTMSVSPSWPMTRTCAPLGISAPVLDRADHSSPTA